MSVRRLNWKRRRGRYVRARSFYPTALGVPVSWEGTLATCTKLSNGVGVWLKANGGNFGEMVLIQVELDLSKYPFLLQAKTGTTMRAAGIIEKAGWDSIELRDASLNLI